MKIYKGNRNSYNVITKKNDLLVTVEHVGSTPIVLSPATSLKFFNHSPDGFNWGYAGSGPAQLALAILLDVTMNAKLAITFHQDFKRAFVAGWDDEWQITSDEVRLWLGDKIIEKYKPVGESLSFDDTKQLYISAVTSELYPDEALNHLAEQLHEIERQRHVDQDEARMREQDGKTEV